MSSDHVIQTSDFLLGAQSVGLAAQNLRNLVGADPATLEFATAGLERAARNYSGSGSGYRDFMFTEIDDATDKKEDQERLAEDVLVSVLSDFEVANVLMAAGQTLGETGEKAEPQILDNAMLRLDNTTRSLSQSLASPLSDPAKPGRFGFAEAFAVQEPKQSKNLQEATDLFRTRSDEVLASLVNEAQGVVTGSLTSLSKIDPDKVLEAIQKLGVEVGDLPKVGRLFRLGVEQLERAMDGFIKLLGSEALAALKEKAQKVWGEFKDGKYIAQILEWAFGIEAVKARIEEILESQDLELKQLDDGTATLSSLETRYVETMAVTEKINSAIALATSLLILTAITAPQLALVSASAYLIVIAAVILTGLDYADSGGILRRVEGVQLVAESVVSK